MPQAYNPSTREEEEKDQEFEDIFQLKDQLGQHETLSNKAKMLSPRLPNSGLGRRTTS